MADQPNTHVNNAPLDREAARARLHVLRRFIISQSEIPERADQSSSAIAFLNTLPIVKIGDLPDEDLPDECHICKEPFSPTPITPSPENTESAVKLPCNHIFGASCLEKWFQTNTSCPLCRTNLFGPIQQDTQALWEAIDEWSVLVRQTTLWDSEEVLERVMRERDRNDEDLTELQTLTIETGELVQRLDELNVAEETEASRVAMERIGRRNGEITARLAVVEKRIARRNRVLTAHEERIARRY